MERLLSTTIESTNLDYASDDRRADSGFLGVSMETWSRVLLIGVLFAAVFWPNLRRLWLKTNPFSGEANWSHSIFVPVIGLYYLFVHREDLIRAGAREFIWGPIFRPGRLMVSMAMAAAGAVLYFLTQNREGLIFTMLMPIGEALAVLGVLVLLLDWSLATIFFGLAVFVYGIYPGQNDYLKDLGMVITLFGIVLLLNGWSAMRIAWFPVVFLVCAIPWPGLVYSWVAEPLSQMAAHIAVDVLKITGVDAVNSGTKIIIFTQIGSPPRILNVAEACAGMRSLMTFIAVGGAVAFLPARPLWQRLIIVISSVPIAIFCNVMRISGQGLLDHYVSEKWSDSFAHQFVGMIMLLPAFFLIMLVGVALDKVFIEEADDDDLNRSSSPGMTLRTTPVAASLAAPSLSAPSLSAPSLSAPVIARPAMSPSGVAGRTTQPASPVQPRTTALPPRPAGVQTPPRPAMTTSVRPQISAASAGPSNIKSTAPGSTSRQTSPQASPQASPQTPPLTSGVTPPRPVTAPPRIPPQRQPVASPPLPGPSAPRAAAPTPRPSPAAGLVKPPSFNPPVDSGLDQPQAPIPSAGRRPVAARPPVPPAIQPRSTLPSSAPSSPQSNPPSIEPSGAPSSPGPVGSTPKEQA